MKHTGEGREGGRPAVKGRIGWKDEIIEQEPSRGLVLRGGWGHVANLEIVWGESDVGIAIQRSDLSVCWMSP